MNELEKWGQAVDAGLVDTINSFIEFLNEKEIYLKPEHIPLSATDFQNLIYEFFNVNPIELEKERRKLLEDFQISTHTQNL